MTTVTIKTARLTLNGNFNIWSEGHKKYAGSVTFDSKNYTGFMLHDGTVELFSIHGFNTKKVGLFTPKNFIYA